MVVVVVLGMLLACDGTPPVSDEIVLRPDGQGEELYDRLSRTYQDRNATELTHQLEHRHEDAAAVMEMLALQRGDVVADIGCGVGYFTRRLSAAVGDEGVVHALDIQPEAIALLTERLGEGPDALGNVRAAVSAIDDVGLEAHSLDVGFMAHLDFYLQENLLPENIRFLESVYRSIRPGGRLMVLQFIAPGQTVDLLSANFQAVGFVEQQHAFDANHQSHTYVFSVPETDAPQGDEATTDNPPSP